MPRSADWESGILSTRPAHIAEEMYNFQRINHKNITIEYIEKRLVKGLFPPHMHMKSKAKCKKTTFITNSQFRGWKLLLKEWKSLLGL